MKHTNYLLMLVLGLLTGPAWMAVHATDAAKVGTPRGEFAVSPLGGATYSVAIDCPPGINGMAPKIALTYNSQSGYGLAGYGVGISGISAITRGPKDMYHDGVVSGMRYRSFGDALFLDGKRLVQNGISEAFLTVEGDPYIEVLRHGSFNDGATDIWYEVKDHHTGMSYKYGATADSRQTYTNQNGISHIGSWYISSTEDVNSNYITYTYSQSNLCIRPYRIFYGMNRNAGNSYHLNSIEFDYEALGADARPFVIEDAKGQIDFRLKSVRSATYGNTYRQYDLSYSTALDGSCGKFARLLSVTEKNGNGDAMNPVAFSWNGLPTANVVKSDVNVSMDDSSPNVHRKDLLLIPADMNGDGVNDIIRLSRVDIGTSSNGSSDTYLYISRSNISSDGIISYSSPKKYQFGAQVSDSDISSIIGGLDVVDFDGDGINDLMLPIYSTMGTTTLSCCFVLSKRLDMDFNDSPLPLTLYPITNGDMPLLACFDYNGDGRDDVFMLEKSKQGLYYPASMTSLDGNLSFENYQFTFSLPKAPKRLYAADFNNDGLKDLIVFHENGYKIYLNQGTNNPSLMFNDIYSVSGTSVKDSWRMGHGDFNGDGLLDFVFNVKGETTLQFALNNGDGTFDVSTAYDLTFGNHGATGDDIRFAVMVGDLDHDGRSDVVVSKAHYKHHGGLNPHDSYTQTYVRWLCSTGSALTLLKSVETHGEDDAREGHLAFGDFDGDGCDELLSYGNSLIANSTADDPSLHLYKIGSDMPSKGKVYRITDGLGRTTDISYAPLSRPSVYQAGTVTNYPMVESRLPLHVVSSVSQSNGAAGQNTTLYQYEGLRVHLAGKGLLGFEGTTAVNATLGTKAVSAVEQWDTQHYVPSQTRSEAWQGNDVTTTETAFTILQASQNYMACPGTVVTTDADGYVSQTAYTYDATKGVPLTVTESSDNGSFWKSTAYSDYHDYKGCYQPWTVTATSKHPDDSSTFAHTTTLRYDSCGRVSQTVEHYGTPMALTTAYTYDHFGNQLSSVQSGSGVTSVTTLNTYDYYGRFLTNTQTDPQTSTVYYTYDMWGHPTRKTMYNPATHITDYAYDGWGMLTSETSPHDVTTTYEEGWGTTTARRYWRKQSTPGQPWVKVWYDEQGREVERQSVGQDSKAVSVQQTYDSRGNMSGTASTTGSLTLTESFTYDDRGRLLTDTHSSGRTTAYSYAGRTVTTTLNGHEYTKAFDAWGNVVTSADTLVTVSYTYFSSGLPATATTGGSTVSMQYDAAGHRTQLTDPDAGTTTSTYAADGKLLSQTDARGITTTYTYDQLGNVTTQQTGTMTVSTTYGTSGSKRLLPQQASMGGNTVSYTYDSDDRVIAETRSFADGTQLSYTYTYNDLGQLVQRTMPGGLTVGYQYDSHGFLNTMTADGQQVYRLVFSTGLRDSTILCGTTSRVSRLDANGNLTRKLYENSGVKHDFSFSFDGATGNLLSRGKSISAVLINPEPLQPGSAGTLGHGSEYVDPGIVTPAYPFSMETFTYDALDRLVGTSVRNTQVNISYDAQGNILSKTGVGEYSYSGNQSEQPHAVLGVTNPQGKIPSATLLTSFNDMGKISMIEQGDLATAITYGPYQERWKSVMSEDGTTTCTVRYGSDYEQVTQGSTVRDFYYLDNDIVVVRQNGGAFTPLLALTDHLGSVYYLFDASGNVKFSAEYDAWGVPTVMTNTIGFQRGYCGHEMLRDYGLINMNGRLYDPLLGRFLSPDNYVQAPESSQSFNRYSYCMNNPLKYVDEDGEFWHILIGAVVGGVSNLVANWNNIDGFWQGLTSFAVGAGSGAAVAATGGAGALSVIGVSAATGAVTSAANSLIAQTGTNFRGIGQVNWWDVGKSSLVGATSGAASGAVGYFARGITVKIQGEGLKGLGVNGMEIKSPILKSAIVSPLSAAAGHVFGGTVNGLLEGHSLATSLANSFEGVGTSMAIGGAIGVASTLGECYVNKISPWTGKPIVSNPSVVSHSDDFFEGTHYSEKVQGQMSLKDYHGFPESVCAFQDNGYITPITGGDGIVRMELHIPGSYKGYDGEFIFIKEPDGSINHRFFKPCNK